MMRPEELDAIEARAKLATPGPWRVTTTEDDQDYESGDGTVCMYVGDDGGPHGPEIHVVGPPHAEGADPFDDARFMAAAREDVPALVAEVHRLRGALEFCEGRALAKGDDVLVRHARKALGWKERPHV